MSEDLKQEFLAQLDYLQLVLSLLKADEGGVQNKEIRKFLIDLGDYVKHASPEELSKNAESVRAKLKPHLDRNLKEFPAKKSLPEVANEFNKAFLADKDIYRNGLELGWLQNLVDISALGYPKDLPYYARVGIGPHASYFSVEENFLLIDSFYMLTKARRAYQHLVAHGKSLKTDTSADYLQMTMFNADVGTYSRLGVVSFFSFTEAFVNGVGFDYSMRNQNRLTAKEIEVLHGMKDGRYLGLENKIERFQSIIRSDKKAPIVLSDPSQIREPFKSFISEIKEIRDASMHYSASKARIWRPPQEWLAKVESTATLCIKVATIFWLACYPTRPLPEYLKRLDYNEYLKLASERLTTVEQNNEQR